MFWTEKERDSFWKRDQVAFAEKANEYPCCDVPTLLKCIHCPIENCKNYQDFTVLLAKLAESRATGKIVRSDSRSIYITAFQEEEIPDESA